MAVTKEQMLKAVEKLGQFLGSNLVNFVQTLEGIDRHKESLAIGTLKKWGVPELASKEGIDFLREQAA